MLSYKIFLNNFDISTLIIFTSVMPRFVFNLDVLLFNLKKGVKCETLTIIDKSWSRFCLELRSDYNKCAVQFFALGLVMVEDSYCFKQ